MLSRLRRARRSVATLRTMRTTLVVTLLSMLPLLAEPQAARLPDVVESALNAPSAIRALWGISVIDAQTSSTLIARDDNKLFQPASNVKLFTTAAALALLGPSYTMDTRVLAEGLISPAGVLDGNLRLLGGSDPTLSGRAYPYSGRSERSGSPLLALNSLAAQVAASGIRSINGSVIADDTTFPDDRYGASWGWDDLQWEYGAPVSALPVNDNVRFLTLSPGAAPGAPLLAMWDPDLPGRPSGLLITATTSLAGAPPALGVARQGSALRIYGSLPVSGAPTHLALALDDPAQFAAEAFRAALQTAGIAVTGSASVQHRVSDDVQPFAAEARLPVVLHELAPGSSSLPPAAGARVLAQRRSPPLSEIVMVTNKVSQNLHAELLLRLLGRAEGADGSAAQGERVIRAWATMQAHLQPEDFILYDGSGLSNKDLATPRALTSLLRYSMSQPWGQPFRDSLPIAGVDGSLAARLQPLRGRVQAKTGTLSQTDALSGFLTADSGRLLIFSILTNNNPSPGVRATIDQIVIAIAHAF